MVRVVGGVNPVIAWDGGPASQVEILLANGIVWRITCPPPRSNCLAPPVNYGGSFGPSVVQTGDLKPLQIGITYRIVVNRTNGELGIAVYTPVSGSSFSINSGLLDLEGPVNPSGRLLFASQGQISMLEAGTGKISLLAAKETLPSNPTITKRRPLFVTGAMVYVREGDDGRSSELRMLNLSSQAQTEKLLTLLPVPPTAIGRPATFPNSRWMALEGGGKLLLVDTSTGRLIEPGAVTPGGELAWAGAGTVVSLEDNLAWYTAGGPSFPWLNRASRLLALSRRGDSVAFERGGKRYVSGWNGVDPEEIPSPGKVLDTALIAGKKVYLAVENPGNRTGNAKLTLWMGGQIVWSLDLGSPVGWARFSPDFTQVAYLLAGNRQIWALPIMGGTPQPLGIAPEEDWFDWSAR
ncbi:MAG: hypothetical protein HYY09_06140 [Firmicutes bacterium]|nr:hypothetical protein [Bacillota bacterium]